jgi:predicted enzyme related to lactoylglutathione lyase
MFERDRYIPGVPCWVDTNQPDPEAAAAFYGGLFDWDLENMMPPESGGMYYIARIRGEDVAAIGSQPAAAPPAARWNSYVWVDSADDTAAKAREAGGEVLEEPFDVTDAGRMAVIADPEGAAISLWQPGRHRGAQIVNEPGSVNFNGLSTRDLDGARAFYGAVFGWEVLDMGGANGMWRMPGYGDFLEARTPGLRERMREMGAPEGFEDVVATFSRIGADDRDTTPHWGVTFAVADADATAAKVAQLGGRVVVAPFDAPWVRMAIIADPAGAMFVASQFVPENRDAAEASGSTVSAA